MNNAESKYDDQRIRVVIVDDHPSVRTALEYIISSEPDMAMSAGTDGNSFDLAWYREEKPDVTLMDLRMPGQHGLVLIDKIRNVHPNANIIVLTAFDRPEDIYRAIRAGVKGYVVKDAPVQAVVDAIRKVHSGGRYFPIGILEKIASRVSIPDLSEREINVIHRMAMGENNKEIADQLSISLSTVKFHVQKIFIKLGTNDRTKAVVVAISLGIVDIE